MMLHLIVGLVFIVGLSVAVAADPALPTTETLNAFLEYARFLREESQAHRIYLEQLFTILGTIAGALLALFGTVMTWLNWKTRKDVKTQVETSFKEKAKPLIEEHIKMFQNDLQQIQKTFERDVRNKQEILGKQSKDFKDHLDRFQADFDDQARAFEAKFQRMHSTLEGQVRDVIDLLKKTSRIPEMPHLTNIETKAPRILWVDDCPENNLVPRRMFEQVGILITLATSTEQTLNLLNESTFNLVISDMGRENNTKAGLDLLRAIKEKGLDTPVVIYASARALEEYGEQAKNLGAVAGINGVSPLLDKVYELLGVNPLSLQ